MASCSSAYLVNPDAWLAVGLIVGDLNQGPGSPAASTRIQPVSRRSSSRNRLAEAAARSSSPSEHYFVARIMLRSVVSTKAATPCHQILEPAGQSRKRVLPKPSQLCTRPCTRPGDGASVEAVPFSTRFDQLFFKRPSTWWRATPNLRERDFGAHHAAALRHLERLALEARKASLASA